VNPAGWLLIAASFSPAARLPEPGLSEILKANGIPPTGIPAAALEATVSSGEAAALGDSVAVASPTAGAACEGRGPEPGPAVEGGPGAGARRMYAGHRG
jgi:hypothetical protein